MSNYSGNLTFSLVDEQKIRADSFLSSLLSISRSRIQKNIENENLSVNGKIVTKNSFNKFRKKDVIEIEIDPPEEMSVIPQEMELDVVQENEYFLIVNKPAGLVVHPGAGNPSGTLINGVLYYLQIPENTGDPVRPGLVHRIDKDTSGLLVVAKMPDSFEKLSKLFFRHNIEREYICLVGGKLREQEGTVETFHGRDPKNRLRFCAEVNNGRKAVTHYKVVAEYPFASLVKLRLETGRTHQIRMHMKHLGHPILNDVLYGGIIKTSDKGLNLLLSKSGRQLLHAGMLGFNLYDEEYRFNVAPPEDMAAVINYLNSLNGGTNG